MSQQDPKPGRVNVTPLARQSFIRLLDQREQQGIKTYGTTLQTWNGRDAIQDAKEEAVDQYQYLEQIEQEHKDLLEDLVQLYSFVRKVAEGVHHGTIAKVSVEAFTVLGNLKFADQYEEDSDGRSGS